MFVFSSLAHLLALALLTSVARARHPNFPPRPAIPLVTAPDTPVTDRSGATLPPLSTVYLFDQLIDHNNPSKGTFKQRYWSNWQYYEAGGPVILMTPGETNADGFTGYLTNVTINGLIAQANNATVVLIEHRFFGESNPLPDLKDESLALLTIDQAAKDLAFFAKTAVLPQPGGDKINADKVPWVLTGGSYAGALTAWTMVDQPGVFWAGYASSAVVEAIVDYWGYFEPIRQNMPKNCSADVEAVVSHFDDVFTTGTPEEQQSLKEMFGMGDVTHLDDVAGSLRNILWDWQSLQPYVGPGATFFKSCDALEVKDGVNAPSSGWGLTQALEAWGTYFTNTYLPAICGNDTREDCLGTYNASQSFFTDTSLDNADRSWMWSECNEVGYLQDGAPKGWPSLVTRLVQPSYDERQCSYMFPTAFPKPTVPKAFATNAKFHGWDVNIDRLFFANGKQDPWREATVSSDFHTRISTTNQPIFVGNGFHCSDLIVRSSVDPTIKTVIDAGVATISNWIAEWPGSKSHNKPYAVPSAVAFTPLAIPSGIVSASPAEVPAVATQATSSPPETAGGSRRFAVPNAMIRHAVEL